MFFSAALAVRFFWQSDQEGSRRNRVAGKLQRLKVEIFSDGQGHISFAHAQYPIGQTE